MNFDKMGQEKISSIKCHHPPGGSTNFNLNWGSEDIKVARSLQRTNSKTNFNIITGEGLMEDKENVIFNNKMTNNSEVININSMDKGGKILPNLKEDSKKCSIKTDYEGGKNQFNLFGADTPRGTNKVSSIKVTYAPGGKSNVFLGDDKTSYNDYRTRK